jgi:hypothetical protein
MTTITIGATVRPANNGEDTAGRVLHWNRLRGQVVDMWEDCGELRAEVRWTSRCPYPTCLPADWLALAAA